ncbi:MAG: gluconate:H+ symporter, GntP family [Actinomycetota bacterium]|nr:gluconate:H+ symporter, GntP family [Actinomycetota bacterium]
MFFEVGIIVLVPIVYAFSKIANVHPVKFGLPMAGIMLAIHVAVPPHPGIVAGDGVFGADIGLIALISLLICIPLGFLSYWVASIMNRKDYELLPSVRAQVEEFGSDSLVRAGRPGPGHHAIAPPRPALIIFLIAAPIVQILIGTLGTLAIPQDNGWYGLARASRPNGTSRPGVSPLRPSVRSRADRACCPPFRAAGSGR